ncbi:hypothetical protein FE633_26415 [Streptomyces montanus]|uniref:Uncharacterized protein n=1 Tax=Streptomyces montanus TaxID=2580423 RepID=A0A5R9FMV8_9ACTN|nr:hypothetical protein [Streptomyces montanus]TLS43280.1 hypothetical protein FE633_26415 [Streptomyces montanus]
MTSCGRRIAVKCLRLEISDRPINRIALDVGPDRSGEHGLWASLTASEARDLAHRLLAQAALAEPSAPAQPGTPPPSAPPGSPSS